MLRRYARFSLRGAVIGTIFIGAGFGWVVREAQSQRDAVAAILRVDRAVILYDWKFSNRHYDPYGLPWWPTWCLRLLGVDYFGHVKYVRIDGGDVGQVLSHVANLKHLEVLSLANTTRTDAGLSHLTKLGHLRRLTLESTDATRRAIQEIEGCLPDLTVTHQAQLQNTIWVLQPDRKAHGIDLP